MIIAPCAFCNALVSSSNKDYFESINFSSFACYCLTVQFLSNRFNHGLFISCRFAVTSSKLYINFIKTLYKLEAKQIFMNLVDQLPLLSVSTCACKISEKGA